MPSFGREFQSVSQKIGQHLLDPQSVPQYQRLVQSRAVHLENNSLFLRLRLQQNFDLFHQSEQVHLTGIEFQLAALDLGHVQNVCDHPFEKFRGYLGLLQVFLQLFPVVQAAAHQIVQPYNAVERRPYLVTHIGQKGGLRLLGRPGNFG